MQATPLLALKLIDSDLFWQKMKAGRLGVLWSTSGKAALLEGGGEYDECDECRPVMLPGGRVKRLVMPGEAVRPPGLAASLSAFVVLYVKDAGCC